MATRKKNRTDTTPRLVAALQTCIAAGAVVVGLVAHVALGQSVYMSPRNFDSAVFEMQRPHFDGDGTSLTSAAYTASYQFGVGNTGRTFLTASLPVSHTGFDEGESETAIGNPYVGVTLFSKRDPVVYQFGVRAPVASENGGSISGFFGDYDRFEAYQPDLMSFKTSLIYFPSRSGEWVMFTRMSPLLIIRTGDTGSEARGEMFADYSIQFFYYGDVVQGGFGFTGRAALTEKGNFEERTVHHIGMSLQKDLGIVIPGLHFRVPLDSDLREVLDYAFGVILVIPV